jgi:hypothetical protein
MYIMMAEAALWLKDKRQKPRTQATKSYYPPSNSPIDVRMSAPAHTSDAFPFTADSDTGKRQDWLSY